MSLKPYPKYKDSGVAWLGDVPEHWDVKPLKSVATLNDESLTETTESDFSLKYIDIGSVSLDKGIEKIEEMDFKSAPSRARRIVRHGDVIVSTVRTYLKAIAPITNPEDNLIVSTGFAVVRSGKSIQSDFTKYVLQSGEFVEEVIARSTGVSYPAINSTDLARIKLCIPNDDEQTTIANFLDHETHKIDALIAEQEKLITLLAEKRQATISHAVTKGLNPNVPMKDSGVEWLGEVPAHWGLGKVKTYFQTCSGGTPNTSRQDLYYTDESNGIPWVRTTDLKNNELNSVEIFITEQALKDTACAVLPPETVMVAMYGGDGTVGKNGLLTIPAAINQAVCGLLPAKTHLPYYVFRYVQFYRPYWMIGAESSRKDPNISQERVGNAPFPFPPIEEQIQIVKCIDSLIDEVDALTLEATRAISLFKERRTALISAAVTGKIDVRGWRA